MLKDWWAIAKGGNATAAANMGSLQNAMSALDQLLSELTKIKKKAAGSHCDAVTGHLAGTDIDTAAFASLFIAHRTANDYNTEVMNNQAAIATEAEKLKDEIRAKIAAGSGIAEAGARTADFPLLIARSTLTDPSLINRAVSKEDTFRVDAHLTTLKLRLKTRLDDKRWRAFLNYEDADTKIENLSSWFAGFGLVPRQDRRFLFSTSRCSATRCFPMPAPSSGACSLRHENDCRPRPLQTPLGTGAGRSA